MYRSLEWWQLALGAVLTAMVIGGLAVQIVAAKRKRRGDRSARSLSVVGFVSLGVGAVGLAAAGSRLDAQRDPDRSAITITPERFHSAGPPSVSVTAPPGWQVSFAQDAVSIEHDRRGTPRWALMTISSSRLQESLDLDQMAVTIRELLARTEGVALVRGPERTELLGHPALLTVKQAPAMGLLECRWEVRRGRRFASQITCTTDLTGDPSVACRDPIGRLEWVRPDGVPRADLE
jgi:hypothetical protein